MLIFRLAFRISVGRNATDYGSVATRKTEFMLSLREVERRLNFGMALRNGYPDHGDFHSVAGRWENGGFA